MSPRTANGEEAGEVTRDGDVYFEGEDATINLTAEQVGRLERGEYVGPFAIGNYAVDITIPYAEIADTDSTEEDNR